VICYELILWAQEMEAEVDLILQKIEPLLIKNPENEEVKTIKKI